MSYLGSITTVLPLVFFLIFKRNDKEKTLRVIFYYIVYVIVNELVSFILHLYDINILNFLFFVFNITEFTLFSIFFYYALPTRRIVRSIVPALPFLYIIAAAYSFFIVTKRNEFDSFSMGLEAIIILILCIYYLVVSIGKSYNLSIYSTTNFWIIISFLIYLAGTFFLYIMAENMQMDKHFRVLYIIINAVFNILKNVLLSIAMLMKPSSSEERIRPGHVDLDNLFPFNEKNN